MVRTASEERQHRRAVGQERRRWSAIEQRREKARDLPSFVSADRLDPESSSRLPTESDPGEPAICARCGAPIPAKLATDLRAFWARRPPELITRMWRCSACLAKAEPVVCSRHGVPLPRGRAIYLTALAELGRFRLDGPINCSRNCPVESVVPLA